MKVNQVFFTNDFTESLCTANLPKIVLFKNFINVNFYTISDKVWE